MSDAIVAKTFRPTTRTLDEVAVGDELPLLEVPLTRTLRLATAPVALAVLAACQTTPTAPTGPGNVTRLPPGNAQRDGPDPAADLVRAVLGRRLRTAGRLAGEVGRRGRLAARSAARAARMPRSAAGDLHHDPRVVDAPLGVGGLALEQPADLLR